LLLELPHITQIEGLKNFAIQTKLGLIEYTEKGVRMKNDAVQFSIWPGMNGIYQQLGKGIEDSYVPFSGVDSKTLKLVGFCYSVLGLVQKRTPVVIVLTDKGKFFKMLKEGVYVYITEEHYTVWQDGAVTTRNIKTKEETHTKIDKEEMQLLVYETINAVNKHGCAQKPIKIDKRTHKSGSLKHSLYQSVGMPGIESHTLHNLASTHAACCSVYTPVFAPHCVILRIAPYVFAALFVRGECAILDVQAQTLMLFAENKNKETHVISDTTDTAVLQKVLMFAPAA